MGINTDKNSYTLLFAIGMVIIVGTLLAAIDSSLRERIDTNKILEKQQNILYAIGINDNEGSSVRFISKDQAPIEFDKYVVNQIYIQGGKIIEDEEAYLIEVKKEKTLAKDASYNRRLPLFIAEKDDKKYYVAPIRGKGLWNSIWGYVSMDEALARVVIDLSGRSYLCMAPVFQSAVVGDFPVTLVTEFFRAVTDHGNFNLHIDLLRSDNDHHAIEAIFKAFAQTLDGASVHTGRSLDIPSTKGQL